MNRYLQYVKKVIPQREVNTTNAMQPPSNTLFTTTLHLTELYNATGLMSKGCVHEFVGWTGFFQNLQISTLYRPTVQEDCSISASLVPFFMTKDTHLKPIVEFPKYMIINVKIRIFFLNSLISCVFVFVFFSVFA